MVWAGRRSLLKRNESALHLNADALNRLTCIFDEPLVAVGVAARGCHLNAARRGASAGISSPRLSCSLLYRSHDD